MDILGVVDDANDEISETFIRLKAEICEVCAVKGLLIRLSTSGKKSQIFRSRVS